MLHSEYTIASICKAFFLYLMDAEGVESMAGDIFGASEAVNRSVIENMLNQEREHVNEKTKGTSSTATTKASKSEVEKLREQLAQKEKEITNKKTEIANKKTETQNLQQKLATKSLKSPSCRTRGIRRQPRPRNWKRSVLQSLAKQRK